MPTDTENEDRDQAWCATCHTGDGVSVPGKQFLGLSTPLRAESQPLAKGLPVAWPLPSLQNADLYLCPRPPSQHQHLLLRKASDAHTEV